MFGEHHQLRRGIVILVGLIAMMAAATGAHGAAGKPADTVARVHGNGGGTLIDPDGQSFTLDSFRVRGVVKADGSATGKIRFVWRGAFAHVWGDPACEGTCDTVVLKGEVQSGSVASDGTVTLSGTAREVDQRRGHVVYDSGFAEPFYLVAGGSQGKNRFVLQWCLLPPFDVKGFIRANTRGDDHWDGRDHAASRSRHAACGSRG